MDLTSDSFEVKSANLPPEFTRIAKAGDVLKIMNFPMLMGTPAVAIDLDGTLAFYNGWKGPHHIGEPRPNAVWALNCFKYNGWDVTLFTNREESQAIWDWVEKFASGSVDRVNECRKDPDLKNSLGRASMKPAVDLFIDDRQEYWFGRELDWVEVMERLQSLGVFSKGLLPRV